MSDWIDCEPSVDMNDDEYIFFDMYGLPAEYEELPVLLPVAWWLVAWDELVEDRSEGNCDAAAAARLVEAAAAASVSIGWAAGPVVLFTPLGYIIVIITIITIRGAPIMLWPIIGAK